MSTDKSKKHILVVDDEDVYVTMLGNLVRRDGYQVTTASNGKQALELVNQHKIDLILSDVNMPYMNGLELLEEIHNSTEQIPIMFVTGLEDAQEIIKAFRLGVANIISKPFEIEQILHTIERFFNAQKEFLSETDFESNFLQRETSEFILPTNFETIGKINAFILTKLSRRKVFTENDLLSIKLSLYEIIHNAMKHGNLEIDYQEESDIYEKKGTVEDIITKKLENPELRNRKVSIVLRQLEDRAEIEINDQGPGFDHTNLPDPTVPENLLLEHGRGILLTRLHMDDVYFNQKGNQITLVKNYTTTLPALHK